MFARWSLARALGTPSGCGQRPIAAHWVSPDTTRACVVTADGYLIETDLRTFEERVSRVCEHNEHLRHARFLVGASPRLVTSVLGQDKVQRVFLCDLDDGKRRDELTAARQSAGDRPFTVSAAPKQSLDGALFALHLGASELALYDRDGARIRDERIEASFRSHIHVVLSATRVARIRDGDVVISNFDETDEDRVSCGLAHSKERLSLVAAGPSFVAIRREDRNQFNCTLVDLDALCSARFTGLYLSDDWRDGHGVVDARGLVSSGKTLRFFGAGNRVAHLELAVSNARIAWLTDNTVVVLSNGRWSVLSRENASWAHRTSSDSGTFERIAVDDRGAVVAQDDDQTLFYWAASQSSPITTERVERFADSPTHRLLGFAEGASSFVVLRAQPHEPEAAQWVALGVHDERIEERWSMAFARVDECWFDDDAQVFIGSRGRSSVVFHASRRESAPVRVLETPCEGPRRFANEREFEVFTAQHWARFERVDDTFVERERVAMAALRSRQLLATSHSTAAGRWLERYADSFSTPRGTRVVPTSPSTLLRCSRDEARVSFVLNNHRSIAAGAPDARALSEWLAVDPSDPLDTICALAISPDGSHIAVGTARGTIRVFTRTPSPPPSSP